MSLDLFLPYCCLALPIAFSLYLYQNVEIPEKTIEVVLMQPNIDPYSTKYELTNKIFLDQFWQQSKPFLTPNTDYVLTPETYFAEGYGEEFATYASTEIHGGIQEGLAAYPKLQWISGIQFYDTYVQKEAPLTYRQSCSQQPMGLNFTIVLCVNSTRKYRTCTTNPN